MSMETAPSLEKGPSEPASVVAEGAVDVDAFNPRVQDKEKAHVMALATDATETEIAESRKKVKEHTDALIDAGIAGKQDSREEGHWDKAQEAATKAQQLGRKADLEAYQAGRYYDAAQSIVEQSARDPRYAKLVEDKERAHVMALASEAEEMSAASFQARAAEHASALIDKAAAGEDDKGATHIEKGDWDEGVAAAGVAKAMGEKADQKAEHAGSYYDAAQAMIAQSKDRNPR